MPAAEPTQTNTGATRAAARETQHPHPQAQPQHQADTGNRSHDPGRGLRGSPASSTRTLSGLLVLSLLGISQYVLYISLLASYRVACPSGHAERGHGGTNQQTLG